MATLCTNDDLKAVRPNILTYGIVSWTEDTESSGTITGVDKLTEAQEQIARILDIRWYREAAKARYYEPLDPDEKFDLDKVKGDYLKRAAVYKVLELAYQYCMNDAPEPDSFERNSAYFAKQFEKEMDFVIGQGLQYDWSNDGDPSDENIEPIQRRLLRG